MNSINVVAKAIIPSPKLKIIMRERYDAGVKNDNSKSENSS